MLTISKTLPTFARHDCCIAKFVQKDKFGVVILKKIEKWQVQQKIKKVCRNIYFYRKKKEKRNEK
jgi:hypothetical protein